MAKDKRDNIRHSLAHLLAAAVLKKFPKAKLGIGPVIEEGFYYDFKLPRNLTSEDLEEFEKTMRDLIRKKLPFRGRKVSVVEAKKIFKNQPFKLDLIKEFVKEKKRLTIYKTGEVFTDLCRGGHVKNTGEIDPDSFKLDRIAGAYWRGSEKNPQLQRIYGLAFATKQELKQYLKLREEAKKRDHRELGKRLKLFMSHELVGSGLPIWLPNGWIIKNEIERFAEEVEAKAGYDRIATPHIAKEELFKLSGHLPHYAESMFPAMKLEDGNYYLKAMNCPFAHLVYKSEPRSYKDLPLRFAEYGTVYRNELSGTLAGLLRTRMLSMNDAHIYCRADQIEDEFKAVVKMTLYYFKIFGLKDYWFRLSLWDPSHKAKYINEPKNWEQTESILRRVLKKLKVDFKEVKNEAAFYGPKVDFQFRSVIGREETMSTIQLDFAAKSRFGLTYHDKNGKESGEVFVIHRAPLSTHERFLAFLLEHYGGDFPIWLSPIQVAVLAVSKKNKKYAENIFKLLQKHNIRAKLTSSDETLGKRIREAELQKIPYMLILGNKEMKAKNLSVRERHKEKTNILSIEKFLKKILKEIKEKN